MSQDLAPGRSEEKEGESDRISAGEGVKSVTGDDGGMTSEGVAGDSTHTDKVIENGPTEDEESSKDLASEFTEKGAPPYQLVFMEELSSESSLAGSLSPQNLESSGSSLPVPVTAKVNSNEDHLEVEENRNTVSSLTLIAKSNFSCDTVETLEGEGREEGEGGGGGGGEGGRGGGGGEEGGEGGEEGGGGGGGEGGRGGGGEGGRGGGEGEEGGRGGEEGGEGGEEGGGGGGGGGVEGGGGGGGGGGGVEGGGEEGVDGEGKVVRHELETKEGSIIPTDVVNETRSDSVTPPPKPKEHALSRFSSDSDAAITPPFSPIEYHSSEEETGGRTPTFPIMTPSPLPSGTDSPLGDQPSMSILFGGVFYLGSSTVDAPISETEANRKMNILHEQALTSHPMPVILSVPITNDGSVLLKDPKTDQPLTKFPVKMILFCARGNDDNLQDCFCLNVRHKRSGTYHCHVFRCEIMEAVSWVNLSCFYKQVI